MPYLRLSATVLDAPDPRQLAAFYRDLLGWEIKVDEPTWVMLANPRGGPGLSFQLEPNYVPPKWPSTKDDQQMMLHLDIGVQDLSTAGAHAESLGALLADFQPQEHVRVYLDPVGHPFCLFLES